PRMMAYSTSGPELRWYESQAGLADRDVFFASDPGGAFGGCGDATLDLVEELARLDRPAELDDAAHRRDRAAARHEIRDDRNPARLNSVERRGRDGEVPALDDQLAAQALDIGRAHCIRDRCEDEHIAVRLDHRRWQACVERL